MADVNPIQLQKALGGMNYPASKDDLVKHAENRDADKKVLSALKDMPDSETYESAADVNKHVFPGDTTD